METIEGLPREGVVEGEEIQGRVSFAALRCERDGVGVGVV